MIKRLETFDLFFAEGLEENDICNKIKSNERFDPNDEYSHVMCGDNNSYCQVFRTFKPEHTIKKRKLEPVIKQLYRDGKNIWKKLLEHEEFDPKFEYIHRLEFNAIGHEINIIYKVV